MAQCPLLRTLVTVANLIFVLFSQIRSSPIRLACA